MTESTTKLKFSISYYGEMRNEKCSTGSFKRRETETVTAAAAAAATEIAISKERQVDGKGGREGEITTPHHTVEKIQPISTCLQATVTY